MFLVICKLQCGPLSAQTMLTHTHSANGIRASGEHCLDELLAVQTSGCDATCQTEELMISQSEFASGTAHIERSITETLEALTSPQMRDAHQNTRTSPASNEAIANLEQKVELLQAQVFNLTRPCDLSGSTSGSEQQTTAQGTSSARDMASDSRSLVSDLVECHRCERLARKQQRREERMHLRESRAEHAKIQRE
mmetsp:Transcript_54069/g.101452  ORF Transcript_54069/g.101452 Transcript_54069/m.101452 type:complete len:195 (+) Transcript_54069:154-738(+)